MKWLFVLVLLVVLTACSSNQEGGLGPDASPGDVPDFTGSHFVAGTDPTGADYGGRVLIDNGPAPDTYLMAWTISGSLQVGEGVLDRNVLSVEWHTVDGPESEGTAIYTVTVDGGLRGTRTIAGYDHEGTEEIFASTEENP
jgi:hypothetical protein